MKILFINSVSETMTNPAYSRHTILKKLFSELGDVVSLNLHQEKKLHNKILSFLFSKQNTKNMLKKYDLSTFDVVVLTTISYLAMKYIKKTCVKYKKILIIDCVEWASPEEKKLRKLSPSYIHNTRINEHLIDKNVRVISISSYLADYYKSKGIKTVIVPNLVDINSLSFCATTKHSKIELIFAGYPQKKDAINTIVEGILMLNKNERDMINLTIAGIDKKTFFHKYKYLSKYFSVIDSFVNFKGMVDSNIVKELYNCSDFSVLMRNPNLRVCKAGFPTKLLDSFKYSTPVIANLSSDIGKYLIDGQNGYIVDGFSSSDFALSLRRIISLSNRKELNIASLSKNAFNTCVNDFNYLKYVNCIAELIDQ